MQLPSKRVKELVQSLLSDSHDSHLHPDRLATIDQMGRTIYQLKRLIISCRSKVSFEGYHAKSKRRASNSRISIHLKLG